MGNGKKSRTILVILLTAVITTALLTGAVWLMMRAGGATLVNRAEYEKTTAIAGRYEKLAEVQDTLLEKGYAEVSENSQMEAILKAVTAVGDDPYTVYMTPEEASAWTASVSGDRTVQTKQLENGIVHIRITSFGPDTAEAFTTELKAAESNGARGFILDLRGNQGGYTKQGIEVADRILPEGTITSLQDREGHKEFFNSDENTTSIPYVVLTDGDTASASEIVCAAVKESGISLLIGQKTYGKGLVQEELVFEDGSLLHYTSSEFFAPSGAKIDGVGIKPDVTVKTKEGAKEDRVLARGAALLLERIDSGAAR